MPDQRYTEDPGARSFVVLLAAKTENAVFLKRRRIPFAVLDVEEGNFPFPENARTGVVRRVLGRTVISITEKLLSGRPWISRYGKPAAGEALTELVRELFGALPETESVLVFSNPGGRWRLVGYRLGVAGGARTAGLELNEL